jgi:hypothetical protein
MLKEELIDKLSALPDGIEIRIVDYKLNYLEFIEYDRTAGIYDEFEVVLFDNEMNTDLEEGDEFAALIFHNPDLVIDDDDYTVFMS